MTDRPDWTDEQLGALLTDTFAAHESLADPDVARRVAAEARPTRHWPAYVAAAAAVVLVAGVGTLIAHRQGGSSPDADAPTSSASPSTPSTGTGPPPLPSGTVAENKAKADAETKRFVELVPLPDGTTRLGSKPAGYPDSFEVPGPSDTTLTHTSWWSVPADAATVRDFLYAHQPEGMGRTEAAGSSANGGDPIFTVEYHQVAGTDPAAYLPVTLLVAFVQHGDQTLVRADTFSAARYPRPGEADVADVVAVDIQRVGASSANHQTAPPAPPVHLTEPADHATIGRLVTLVNGLPGSVTSMGFMSCPAVFGPPPSETLTFTSTSGRVVTMHLEPACFGQVHVTVDGQELATTLDPGTLENLLETIDPLPAR